MGIQQIYHRFAYYGSKKGVLMVLTLGGTSKKFFNSTRVFTKEVGKGWVGKRNLWIGGLFWRKGQEGGRKVGLIGS